MILAVAASDLLAVPVLTKLSRRVYIFFFTAGGRCCLCIPAGLTRLPCSVDCSKFLIVHLKNLSLVIPYCQCGILTIENGIARYTTQLFPSIRSTCLDPLLSLQLIADRTVAASTPVSVPSNQLYCLLRQTESSTGPCNIGPWAAIVFKAVGHRSTVHPASSHSNSWQADVSAIGNVPDSMLYSAYVALLIFLR
ncbi:hypothetical protein BKA93DRAFT_128910 [Sparassis latifolia]